MGMRIYGPQIYSKVRRLRLSGRTYPEIQKELKLCLPYSSLSYICKDLKLGSDSLARINQVRQAKFAEARAKALKVNRLILEKRIAGYRQFNAGFSKLMAHKNYQIVALAMLYLGEGAKWQGSRCPKLGSSNPRIVRLYVDLLSLCYSIKVDKLWARVQHRADQDPTHLVKYWSAVTGIRPDCFYPCYIDKRTVGIPTTKKGYMGVCTIGSAGTHIQLELQEIADIIGDAVRGISSSG